MQRARGAFIRSRAKWTEAGEKNSSYFSNLEKRRQQTNSVTSLMINGVETKDFKLIEREVFSFCSKLYSSESSSVDTDTFFTEIQNMIPCVEKSFKDLCDSDVKIEELDAVIAKMAPNKAPGSDGSLPTFISSFGMM